MNRGCILLRQAGQRTRCLWANLQAYRDLSSSPHSQNSRESKNRVCFVASYPTSLSQRLCGPAAGWTPEAHVQQQLGFTDQRRRWRDINQGKQSKNRQERTGDGSAIRPSSRRRTRKRSLPPFTAPPITTVALLGLLGLVARC